MSAIWGIFNRDGEPIDGAAIERMHTALLHRGLDGDACWQGGTIAFGQQHFRITPESLHETLPYYNRQSRLAIVADCRLDYRAELCTALGLTTVDELALPDSQLLLCAYQKWGQACTEHLLGDFAFAIWDEVTQQLFVASDPMGVRPLYYYQTSQHFIFASEIRGIYAHPAVCTALNHEKLATLVMPLASLFEPESTYFTNIQRLSAATTLLVKANHIARQTYWQPNPTARLAMKPDEVIASFREVLLQAVSARLRSASPVAALLSGGLDSSAIVATAATHLRTQQRKLITLSAVLPEDSTSTFCDERHFIEKFRSWDNLEMIWVTDPNRGPFDDVGKVVELGEQPMLTSRHYLYSAFAEQAHQRGVRVVIDGMGGEVGPSFYGQGYLPELVKRGAWPSLLHEVKQRAIVEQRSQWQIIKSEVIRPFFSLTPLSHLRRLRSANLIQSQTNYLLQPAFVNRYLGDRQHAVKAQIAQLDKLAVTHRHQQARLQQAVSTLPGNAFVGAERVQLVYPFLDKRLLEFCLAAPGDVKVHNGYRRYLIRAGLDGLVPPDIQWRTSKEPFSPDFPRRYNRQRGQAQAILDAIADTDPLRTVVNVEQLQILAKTDMQGNRGNTRTDFAAMHIVPSGIYLITFLQYMRSLGFL